MPHEFRDVLGRLDVKSRRSHQAEGARFMGKPPPSRPKKRRERGDDGISWDKINKCYVGTDLARQSTAAESAVGEPCAAGPRPRSRTSSTRCTTSSTPASRPQAAYTRPAVRHGLARFAGTRPAHHGHLPGQAEKWIYPAIGATKLKDFKATDADRFFRTSPGTQQGVAVKIKSTLIRSIRRAQKYDLIGRNVAKLSTCRRAARPPVTGHERGASGPRCSGPRAARATGYAKVVKVSPAQYAATHAAFGRGSTNGCAD